MGDDLQILFANLTISEDIIEDKNFRTQFASCLEQIEFNVSNDNPERIWKVLVRVVKIVSASSNVDWPINIIVELLEKLEITSVKVFEYERFCTEFEYGLRDVGLNVNNYNLNEIWRKLYKAVTASVSKVKNDVLKNNSRLFVETLSRTQEWITKNQDFRTEIVNGLKEAGFYPRNDKPEQISLSKVLRLAADSSVCAGRNINLGNENIEDTKLRLEQLLLAERAPNRNIGNSLDDVLYRPLTQELASQLTSPQDIANKNFVGIKQDTHKDFVTNLIEKQFLIKWNTVRGEPEEFNFYTFCDVEKLKVNEEENPQNVPMEVRRKHLQYEPRRAHVKVQLYRYCRTKSRIEFKTNQLCPPVYIRTNNGWKKWVPSENNNIQQSVHPVDDTNTEFHWMNVLIKAYIISFAIEIDEARLEQTLLPPTRPRKSQLSPRRPPTPTLYWAVVNDTDFEIGEHLQLNDIGRTQVYVGKAEPGINMRWLKADSSHCRKMKKCLDNVQEMTTYDPLRLDEIQLVDARILLAKLKGEECALFVMKTYDGREAIADLEKEETANIKGESRNGNKLLSAEVCQNWMPKNMAYGMNCRA